MFMHFLGLIIFSLRRQYSHWLEWEFCCPEEYMFGCSNSVLTSLVNHCIQVLCILLRSKKYLSKLLFVSNCKFKVILGKSAELHWFQWSYSDLHWSVSCPACFYDLEDMQKGILLKGWLHICFRLKLFSYHWFCCWIS